MKALAIMLTILICLAGIYSMTSQILEIIHHRDKFKPKRAYYHALIFNSIILAGILCFTVIILLRLINMQI